MARMFLRAVSERGLPSLAAPSDCQSLSFRRFGEAATASVISLRTAKRDSSYSCDSRALSRTHSSARIKTG